MKPAPTKLRQPPPLPAPKPSGQKDGWWQRFRHDTEAHFRFRVFVIPDLIRVGYAFVFAGCTIGFLVGCIMLMRTRLEGRGFIWIIVSLLGLIVFRISCELVIVVFSIHERLNELSERKEKL